MKNVFGVAVLFLLLLTSTLSASTSFTLDQIASSFPSAGLEPEVEFWVEIFARYGDREVLLHDQNDVRLVYETVVFPRGVRNDRTEYRRQRDQLKKKTEQLQRKFDEISRYGPDSDRLTDTHRHLIQVLTAHGYQPTDQTLGQLRRNIRGQRGIRERFLEGLIRSGKYLERMKEILEQEGVPTELAYMPHVESSFDYRAYSKKGAAGMWQFMRGTGRLYMTINSRIDERLDPIKATQSAARLLRDNYQELGAWPLAVTAFNHGRNGMLRAKRQFGDDIRVIIQRYRSRTFGFASKHFYAEFLAALIVAKNYRDYFGPVDLEPPLEFDTVRLKAAYHLSHILQGGAVPEAVLREYNRHVRERVWDQSRVLPAGTELRLPKGTGQQIAGTLKKAPKAGGTVITTSDGRLAYRVQDGDTLGTVAARLGTSIRSLQRVNGIRNPNRIYPGQLIVASEAPPDTTQYRVRPGDTLAQIASRFGVSVGQLQEANRIENPHQIHLGQLIQIPH